MGQVRGRVLCGVALGFSVSMSAGLAAAADRPVSAEPPMASSQTAEAFAAVFGSAAPVTRVVAQPSGPSCCRTVMLSVTAGDLVDLGAGRYALVSLETNRLGSHAEPGAISIAYLDEHAGNWRVEHVWNEIAWTGDTGQAADFFQDLAPRGATPVVFAVRSGVWQGEQVTTAWAFTLAPKGPQAMGEFNAGGALDADNGCSFSICGAWAYIASIGRPSAQGALFSVAYGGWREAPGVHDPRPFAAVTNYVERNGALVAKPPVKLPDQ